MSATTTESTNGILMDISTISLSSFNRTSNKENLDFGISSNPLSIVDIQSAITTKQRLIAFHRLRKLLQKAISSETHVETSMTSSSELIENNNSQHLSSVASATTSAVNLEQFIMRDGGITVIIMQLHHLVYSHGTTIAELEVICMCLLILFRSCWRRRTMGHVQQHILQNLAPDLLILLSNAVLVVISQRKQRQNQFMDGVDQKMNSVLLNVMTIFNIISSSFVGTNSMIKCRIATETIIRMLENDGSIKEHDADDDNTIFEVLGCLKNLTYFQEEYRMQLVQSSSGFIKSLGSLLLSKPALSMKSRQRLSAVIRNLSICIECRAILVAHPTIIETLIQLLNCDDPQTTINGDDDTLNMMKRNVVSTFVSLSMDHDSALILIFYGDGILPQVLQRHLKYSSDVFLRKKSACILRLLTNEMSAPLLVHDSNLMYSLSDAALRDDSSDVRKEAAEAFARCAAFVQIVEQQPHYYDSVLDALTVLVSRRSRLKVVAIDSLARAIRDQSSHEGNQRPMADRSVLLDAMSEIARSREYEASTASRDATCALMNLSSHYDNLEKLARNPLVLEAILSIASAYRMGVDATVDNGKTYALTTLVNLTRNSNCRKIMIRHRCLLQTMIQEIKYVPTEQSVLKEKLKQASILLASEL